MANASSENVKRDADSLSGSCIPSSIDSAASLSASSSSLLSSAPTPPVCTPEYSSPSSSSYVPSSSPSSYSSSSLSLDVPDPRYTIYSTLADEGDDEDHLLSFDYDALPTYPLRPSYRDHPELGNMATHIVSFDPCRHDPYHPASMPIYQTATFQQPSIEKFGPYDYTRSGNPTRTAVEQLVASLEGAHAAFAFTTGLAAMTAVTRLVECGGHIISGDDVYGGVFRLLTRISSKQGIKASFVDTSDLQAVKHAITPTTKLVWVESPSNPLMRITDLRKLAAFTRERNILLVVDSTMMSPFLMKPLLMNADIVIHSATKFLVGHSDTMAGFVCCSTEDLAREIAFVQNAEGNGLAPFDCWLVLRGLKTLTIRQERAQENAMQLASFLAAHPLVKALHYAGHPKGTASESSLKLHRSQAKGGGSVISFETHSVKLSRKICDFCKIFKITVSFGACNSLIEMPCVLSHASIPREMRSLPEDLIRISVGIEHVDDLLADLSQAMKKALEFYQKTINGNLP